MRVQVVGETLAALVIPFVCAISLQPEVSLLIQNGVDYGMYYSETGG